MATDNTINVDEDDTIDLSEYPAYHSNNNEPKANAYDKSLCQDNKEFTSFLNKCLFLEQTVEMEKIIQKVLLPAYVCADDEYKKSEKFTRVIKKAIQRLIDEPKKKYSHISDVTDTLKFHVKKVPRKKVNFVTLSTTTSVLGTGKSNEDRKRVVVDNKRPKKSKKPRLDVIAVDSEDDDSDDVIPVEDTAKDTVYDDLIAAEKTAKKTVDVSNTGNARVVEDLIDAHDIAKKIFGAALCADGQANKMKVDTEVIAVDDEVNEIKNDNSVARAKPKKNTKRYNKMNIKDFVDTKKSRHKLAGMLQSQAESYKKSPVKIKETKSKESKENYSPNGSLEVGNNNNTPIEIIDSQEIRMQDDEIDTVVNGNSANPKIKEGIHHDKENSVTNENLCDSNNKLLVPRMEVALEENKSNERSDARRYKRIKVIEAEIVKYKKKIADLEVAEVTEDSSVSAYIRCDRLQAHIVKLYKELCRLNDAEPVKGRQVRLHHLAEGIPQGPVMRLERFLNKQVDEDGVAPFPDFSDVVRCIEKSNVKDGLQWTRAKVLKEAHALFESCGRALQKRRQRREWKDLRSQLPREAFDADPAAGDPELAAKLELNRRVALQRETEILEKYSRMEATSEKVSAPQNGDITQDTDESGSSSGGEQEKDEPQTLKINEIWSVAAMPGVPSIPQTIEGTCETLVDIKEPYEETSDEPPVYIKEEPNKTNEMNDELLIHIKEEPYEVPVDSYFKLNVSIAIEISDSDSSDEDSIYSYVE